MNTKVTLNTTIKSLPKNEILDFAPRGNGGVFIHNGNTICHTEGEARSISKEVQNRDISAFSKPQYDNVSVSRDISVASLPQYDKHTVIASERNFSRHCETYEVSRGNLVRVAKDFRNAQLAIQGDCHDLPLASLAMTKKHKIATILLFQSLAMTGKVQNLAMTKTPTLPKI